MFELSSVRNSPSTVAPPSMIVGSISREKTPDNVVVSGGVQRVDGCDDEASVVAAGATRWTGTRIRQKSRLNVGWAEEQHVVRIDHRGVGGIAVQLPNRSAVKALQRLSAGGHIGKPAQPDETIGVVDIAKLADHADPECFLALDEFPIEEIDENLARARVERVLAELDDRQRGHLGCGHEPMIRSRPSAVLARSGHRVARPGGRCRQRVGGPFGDLSRTCHASEKEIKAPTAAMTAVSTRKYRVVVSIVAPL